MLRCCLLRIEISDQAADEALVEKVDERTVELAVVNSS